MMTTTHRCSSRFLIAARAAVLGGALLLLAAPAANAQAPAQASPAPASLDAILKQVSTFDGGIESASVWSLREYVYARKDDPAGRAECEAKLLQFLKSPATPVAKVVVSHHLRVIAGDTAVPALRAMLADPKLADPAIYVLQQLPGPVAEAALVQALVTARGNVKVSTIAALGARHATAAVPALVPLLKQPELTVASATALGSIGGPDAAAGLASAFTGGPPDVRRAVAGPMLAVADGLLAARQTGGALDLYRAVSSDRSLPPPVRRAAFMGGVSAADAGATGLVLTMLRGVDQDEQSAAIAKIVDAIPADGIAPVCDLLPRLSEPLQVQALAALATYPGDRVRPAILEAARASSPAVRVAALKALESAGDSSVVPFLVERAASAGKGAEQDAARRALGMLKGRAIDEAILGMLGPQPSGPAAGELLKAAADRRIFLARPAVAAALLDASAATRAEALKALRVLGTPSDVSAVLDLLIRSSDDKERLEAGTAAAALLGKITNPEGRSRLVRTRLAREKDAQIKASLIGVLPLTADDAALPLLRTALADNDPAVVDAAARAVSAWPTAAARDDVLAIARGAKDETHRLLAIGGLVRLIGLEANRRPEAAVADLKQASGLAWRPEERKLVLGALASFPCKDALDLATSFLQDAAVKAEAAAAVDRITQRMSRAEAR
jgi:HEAT repeat protein